MLPPKPLPSSEQYPHHTSRCHSFHFSMLLQRCMGQGSFGLWVYPVVGLTSKESWETVPLQCMFSITVIICPYILITKFYNNVVLKYKSYSISRRVPFQKYHIFSKVPLDCGTTDHLNGTPQDHSLYLARPKQDRTLACFMWSGISRQVVRTTSYGTLLHNHGILDDFRIV